jgi:hypothetical protein
MNISSKSFLREFPFTEVFKFDFKHLMGDLIGGLTSAIVALALGFGILAYNRRSGPRTARSV